MNDRGVRIGAVADSRHGLTFLIVEEKYGKSSASKAKDEEDDSENSSSTSEEEDDEGQLATEALDAEMSAVLKAIRSKDPRIKNKDFKFK